MTLSNTQQYMVKTLTVLTKWIFVFVILQFVIASAGRVQGQSMEPTLLSGQQFVVWKVPYFFHAPRRLQVVQIIDPTLPRRLIVKRVIGLPGETVSFVDGAVMITDTTGYQFTLSEPYLPTGLLTNVPVGRPTQYVIPPNHYFVLGDNRGNSLDSRYFGPVHRRNINGTIKPF